MGKSRVKGKQRRPRDAEEIMGEHAAHHTEDESCGEISTATNTVGPKWCVAMWDLAHCDAKKCTGKKLERLGKLKVLSVKQKFRGIVLSPRASHYLSQSDFGVLCEFGVAAIDCSWNNLSAVPFRRLHNGYERKLPFLVAANPPHYGKPYELSCVEALGATLLIGGLDDKAEYLFESFNWASAFKSINWELIELYRGACATSATIQAAQDRYISDNESSKIAAKRGAGKTGVASVEGAGGVASSRGITTMEDWLGIISESSDSESCAEGDYSDDDVDGDGDGGDSVHEKQSVDLPECGDDELN